MSKGDFRRAQILCRQALALAPHDPDALCLLGITHLLAGKASEALPFLERAISVKPAHGLALEQLGIARFVLSQYAGAEVALRAASTVSGAPASVFMRLGVALFRLGKHADAITALERALMLSPNDVDSHLNLGQVLADKGDTDAARDEFEVALKIRPNHADAMFNLGVMSLSEDRLSEARLWFERVIAHSPEYSDAYVNLGIAIQREGDLAGAVAIFTRAIALDPRSAAAHFNLAAAFSAEGRTENATECYRNVLDIEPLHAEARMALAMSTIPAVYETVDAPARSRTLFSGALDDLKRWFHANPLPNAYRAVGALQPFLLSYQEENNRDLLRCYGDLCAELMSQWFQRQKFAYPKNESRNGTVRVGIVSQYFWKHPVWDAIVKGWFEQIDQKRFPLFAFHLGTGHDEETMFAQARVSEFVHGPLGLPQWIETIISRKIDVLIYPEIGMDPLTLQLASLRLASVQVATWGHPDTTGLPTIDYYLSGKDIEPPNAQENYTEKLIELPHLGCFYKPSPIVPVAPDLSALGLEPDTPLFLLPGVPFKYSPQHDEVFVEIARALSRCRFIFFKHRLGNLTDGLSRRLASAFARAGLEFSSFFTEVSWLDPAEFHGLLERADVFLDTIGFSGFNTAMQAVKCGLPIVTREGKFMRGRLASGILVRMGLEELVVQSNDQYVALAVRLARDVEYRRHIRKRIEESRDALFEDTAPIRAMEAFLGDVASIATSR